MGQDRDARMCFVCIFLKIIERQQFGSIRKQLGKTEKMWKKTLYLLLFSKTKISPFHTTFWVNFHHCITSHT
jgi:hypothetical protein